MGTENTSSEPMCEFWHGTGPRPARRHSRGQEAGQHGQVHEAG